ncbi:MAG: DUF721 domain-containing protein [Acidobacteria bacterium]|nr:DUF721 domain-containing protein [Acidobacteriota bacterium]
MTRSNNLLVEARSGQPEKIGAFLSNFLSSIAADEEVSLIFLKELWPRIVGADVARKCLPAGLQNGTLILSVASPVWQDQLASLGSLLLQSINSLWNCVLVKRLEFQISESI